MEDTSFLRREKSVSSCVRGDVLYNDGDTRPSTFLFLDGLQMLFMRLVRAKPTPIFVTFWKSAKFA